MLPIADMSFETALAELESIVEKLEAGTLALDETVSLYQRGRGLAEQCQHLLDTVDLKVQQLVSDGEGGEDVVDFEAGA